MARFGAYELDISGHLFEGAVIRTAAQVDAWIAHADTEGRVAQLATARRKPDA
jgi:hypothetical protein